MRDIIIEEQKSKLMQRLVIAVCMVIASAVVLVLGFLDQILIMKIVGVAAVCYFLVCLVILAKRALRLKPLLTITEESVIDSSAAVSLGEVPFSEIERFEIVNLYGQRAIGIRLKDADRFLERLSKAQKKNAQFCMERGFPPVSLRVDTAKDMTIEDILSLLEKRLADYKSLYE